MVRQLKTSMSRGLTRAQLLVCLTHLNCQLGSSLGEAGEKSRSTMEGRYPHRPKWELNQIACLRLKGYIGQTEDEEETIKTRGRD